MPITKATPNVISPISTTNLANSIVLRDASGNFSAGTITAALSGNASSATTATTATTAGTCTGNSATATKLQTARTIALTGSVTGSASFDGSANISIATTGGSGSVSSAKAWVNFNGTTSPGTIRSSYNVSSVTKSATGRYIVNFTTAMTDTNYSVVMGTSCRIGSVIGIVLLEDTVNSSRTTSLLPLTSLNLGSTYEDTSISQVAIFGN